MSLSWDEFKALLLEAAQPRPPAPADWCDAMGEEIEHHPIMMPRARREKSSDSILDTPSDV